MLKSALLLLLHFCLVICRKGKFEGFIVQGEDADIRYFPYSVFLYISGPKEDWICGGSLLNQDLVLSAAHCLYGARPKDVMIKYGHESRFKGHTTAPFHIIVHNLYVSTGIEWDIGIMKLISPVKFGVTVGRVAIMRNPPYGVGLIAGWGALHDYYQDEGIHDLQYTQQWVSNRSVCQEMIGYVPIGTICGGYFGDYSYPSRGDSGSALVVKNYIQIGIVSFKRLQISSAIVVYSDVAYYYDWISRNAYYLCVLKKEEGPEKRKKTTTPKYVPTPVEYSYEEDFFYFIFPIYGN